MFPRFDSACCECEGSWKAGYAGLVWAVNTRGKSGANLVQLRRWQVGLEPYPSATIHQYSQSACQARKSLKRLYSIKKFKRSYGSFFHVVHVISFNILYKQQAFDSHTPAVLGNGNGVVDYCCLRRRIC